MNNIMVIDGYRATIQYDPEIEMFRGEFDGLNGSADFYADSVEVLQEEGRTSLRRAPGKSLVPARPDASGGEVLSPGIPVSKLSGIRRKISGKSVTSAKR